MRKEKKILTALFLVTLVLMSGCFSSRSASGLHGERGVLNPGGIYVIQRGDTLFGIAWRYGLDTDELAAWNNIRNKNKIFAGQKLRTAPPGGITRKTVATPKITSKGAPGWVWPVSGTVVSGFSSNKPGKQGIKIKSVRGRAVNAANAGEVAYTGSGLSGFGRMVIIRHSGNVLTAYGYLDSVNVKEGQRIARRQKIGSVGIGPTNEPLLYFEMRKQGKPVNPYRYIGTSPRY